MFGERATGTVRLTYFRPVTLTPLAKAGGVFSFQAGGGRTPIATIAA
jgi:hypothetical protein